MRKFVERELRPTAEAQKVQQQNKMAAAHPTANWKTTRVDSGAKPKPMRAVPLKKT